ncbi:unnamed protein product [Miscanthus lutarioriparius]|uniref:Uncharacterized protein n=1 Tax=Miscanthus lutarioriparius TaxID=422564 RepID=A0A811Q8D4_9POAL|nr:unnamed protein product [Miscanthus lutarioriparius]
MGLRELAVSATGSRSRSPRLRRDRRAGTPAAAAAEHGQPAVLSLQDLSRKLETTKLHAFTLDELKAATKNFFTTNFLGEGGFGPVYKGFINARLRPGLQPQHVAVNLYSDGVQASRGTASGWSSAKLHTG